MIDVQEIIDFTDFFIICSGTSDRMIDALADYALRAIKTEYKITGGKEGQSADGWMLLDFGDVIVHIFTPDRVKDNTINSKSCGVKAKFLCDYSNYFVFNWVFTPEN